MKVIKELKNFPKEPDFVAVALGNFDGMHQGHQILINQLVENVHQEKKGLSVVFSFNPHPLRVLGKKDQLLLLNTPEDKEKHIGKLGVDIFIPFPFNEKIADMSPENFVTDILIKGLRAKTIYVGYNFTFGRKAMGDSEILKSLCKSYNCQVKILSEVKHSNVHISSTNIRRFILNGDMTMATLFLGYPYSLVGKVISGDQLGRKLGFPTANLKVMNGLVIPKNGVYAVKVEVGQNIFHGVANIGTRPTVDSDLPQSIEIHIIEQDLSLYGQEIRVFFFERLRAEKKFSDLTELTRQITSDITTARMYLENNDHLKTNGMGELV